MATHKFSIDISVNTERENYEHEILRICTAASMLIAQALDRRNESLTESPLKYILEICEIITSEADWSSVAFGASISRRVLASFVDSSEPQ